MWGVGVTVGVGVAVGVLVGVGVAGCVGVAVRVGVTVGRTHVPGQKKFADAYLTSVATVTPYANGAAFAVVAAWQKMQHMARGSSVVAADYVTA